MAALDEGEPRALGDLPTRAMNRRLVRCVPALSFLAGAPPSFLRTSGRPNRFNPRGVDCLYFSETEAVANLEWDRQMNGSPLESQPKLVFFARVKLRRVLDLENPETRRRLELGDRAVRSLARHRARDQAAAPRSSREPAEGDRGDPLPVRRRAPRRPGWIQRRDLPGIARRARPRGDPGTRSNAARGPAVDRGARARPWRTSDPYIEWPSRIGVHSPQGGFTARRGSPPWPST